MALKGVRPALWPVGMMNDFDVLASGVVVGRIFKANAAPVGIRASRGSHADARLCRSEAFLILPAKQAKIDGL
jgi:hypothetical protein